MGEASLRQSSTNDVGSLGTGFGGAAKRVSVLDNMEKAYGRRQDDFYNEKCFHCCSKPYEIDTYK